jgi:hypothetical protein
MMDVVECRSDNEYAGRPRALYWEGQRLEIESLLASWRTPQGKRFRVRLLDGRIFEVEYDETNDGWTIENK